jgi:hypothetical protein
MSFEMRKLFWSLLLMIWTTSISNVFKCCTHGLQWILPVSLGHAHHFPSQSQFLYNHSFRHIPFSGTKLLEPLRIHVLHTWQWHTVNLGILLVINNLTSSVLQFSIQLVVDLTLLHKTQEASHLRCIMQAVEGEMMFLVMLQPIWN